MLIYVLRADQYAYPVRRGCGLTSRLTPKKPHADLPTHRRHDPGPDQARPHDDHEARSTQERGMARLRVRSAAGPDPMVSANGRRR